MSNQQSSYIIEKTQEDNIQHFSLSFENLDNSLRTQQQSDRQQQQLIPLINNITISENLVEIIPQESIRNWKQNQQKKYNEIQQQCRQRSITSSQGGDSYESNNSLNTSQNLMMSGRSDGQDYIITPNSQQNMQDPNFKSQRVGKKLNQFSYNMSDVKKQSRLLNNELSELRSMVSDMANVGSDGQVQPSIEPQKPINFQKYVENQINLSKISKLQEIANNCQICKNNVIKREEIENLQGIINEMHQELQKIQSSNLDAQSMLQEAVQTSILEKQELQKYKVENSNLSQELQNIQNHNGNLVKQYKECLFQDVELQKKLHDQEQFVNKYKRKYMKYKNLYHEMLSKYNHVYSKNKKDLIQEISDKLEIQKPFKPQKKYQIVDQQTIENINSNIQSLRNDGAKLKDQIQQNYTEQQSYSPLLKKKSITQHQNNGNNLQSYPSNTVQISKEQLKQMENKLKENDIQVQVLIKSLNEIQCDQTKIQLFFKGQREKSPQSSINLYTPQRTSSHSGLNFNTPPNKTNTCSNFMRNTLSSNMNLYSPDWKRQQSTHNTSLQNNNSLDNTRRMNSRSSSKKQIFDDQPINKFQSLRKKSGKRFYNTHSSPWKK